MFVYTKLNPAWDALSIDSVIKWQRRHLASEIANFFDYSRE